LTAFYIIVALVGAQRIGELVLDRFNTARLLARGAREYGRDHYPYMVALHASWLVSLVALVPADQPPNWYLLALFGVLQVCRAWVILTLGPYWTTRVVRLSGAPIIRRGPYRLLRHPNYVIVTAEIAVLPLVFGVWEHALLFTLLNAAMLWIRIGVENKALGETA
jgi:methyltransferase